MAAQDEVVQLTEEGMRVGLVCGAGRFDEEGHSVDAETVHPERHPETDDSGDLLANLSIGEVEVWLMAIETVQVILAGFLVELPRAVLIPREDGVTRVRRPGVTPDVIVAIPRLPRAPRGAEPRVLVRGVIDDEVCDDPDAA